jgi:leader peptidase (prepilin peptidase)/N-methyltransferase
MTLYRSSPISSPAVAGGPIDRRHLALELAASAIGALALIAVPGWAGLAGALLGWALLALLALDTEHFWLPDAITLPLLAAGLLLGLGSFEERLLGAAVGGGLLLALAIAYRALRGRDGLGLGDVKLMAALGAWLSLPLIGPLMLLAALTALLLTWLSQRGQRGTPKNGPRQEAFSDDPAGADAAESSSRRGWIPFGACLAVAGFPLWLVAAGSGGALAGLQGLVGAG